MKNANQGLRASRYIGGRALAMLLLASTHLLVGCALLPSPAYEAGWRYGRVLQIGGADATFPRAALDCRDLSASGQAYALVKLGASVAQSRRTTFGSSSLRYAIVRVASGATIRVDDIVQVNIGQCDKHMVRVS
ncbi:hypothetical protein [Pseudoduganella aquatica]|uniref:hypothetical protein n=1 Tax=Pseudoduganella aquatica TaxID=2660641 RepID=UPI001E41989C|nr:hypothetical protein [Pseudoduganella aquatica]